MTAEEIQTFFQPVFAIAEDLGRLPSGNETPFVVVSFCVVHLFPNCVLGDFL